MSGKYDSEVEKEVVEWINKLTGSNIHCGRENVALCLRNGQMLISLINAVYEGTTALPTAAASLRFPFKKNTSRIAFKEMENIEVFLKAVEAYGVPRTSLFQTVDLYETRNMSQVISCLLQLGTECQRHNFGGPVCGPKPTYENKREFTHSQLNASKAIIGLQAGYNKGANQSGLSFGASRHVADLKVDEMSAGGKTLIGLQAGSNLGASQSGMSMGAQRHIADIKVDTMSGGGQSIIGLQAGSNQGASQSGMSMGAQRHIADIKVDPMSGDGQTTIGLQAGSNKGASQSGMSMGSVRHIGDIQSGELSRSGQGVIGLQAGSNQGTSQAGMSFGTQRHINDLNVGGRK
ncbi:unnamed protein product [Schistocephalus solidus]|uniref:Transgelin n=1 Tax=Schistocephalus solidus TaxID=70667 RepID=A0A3P7C315_SCHSO|nr:unnamed protein product [Schistocephalus solidus]